MKPNATGVSKCCVEVKRINELVTKTKLVAEGAYKNVLTSQNSETMYKNLQASNEL
jgi:hypothetical protein